LIVLNTKSLFFLVKQKSHAMHIVDIENLKKNTIITDLIAVSIFLVLKNLINHLHFITEN